MTSLPFIDLAIMDQAKPSGLSMLQARNDGLTAISVAFVYGNC